MEHVDIIVIGSGPGGYVAAQRAGDQGKKVLLVEKELLGGVCTNWGCIPTKSLLNSAKLYVHAKESGKFGVHAQSVTFEFGEAMAWKQEVVETLRKGIGFLMKKSNVTVVNGEAHCLDPSHVKVGDTTYSCDSLILATGSSALIPPIPGMDQDHVVTNREILGLETLPKRLAVIGGGVIGMEFASFFSSVGTEVHVIEMLDEILPMMDQELAKLMRREMRSVKYHLGSKVTAVQGTSVEFTDSKGVSGSVEADLVLVSVGRKPNTAGLEALGLDIRKGAVAVDDRMRTNLPNVYAVGDVVGKSLLAHSASRMGEVAVDAILGKKSLMRYHAVPWAVYSLPEAAGCGLTEQEAKQKGIPVKTASIQMRSNGRFLAEHGKKAGGLCKVVVDERTDVLLGVHLVGAASSEMIYGAAVMIEAELRVSDIKEIIFPHPSVSEIIKDALWALS